MSEGSQKKRRGEFLELTASDGRSTQGLDAAAPMLVHIGHGSYRQCERIAH